MYSSSIHFSSRGPTISTKMLLFFVVFLVSIVFGVACAFAETKKLAGSVPCPSIVADKRTGTFFTAKSTSSPVACFKNSNAAKKAGFDSLQGAQSFNYSGWYRLRLNLVRSTCDDLKSGGPVLFLQVKENDSGVFAEFCPSIGHYSGIRSGNGFTISGQDEVRGDVAGAICDDGQLIRHQFVEMTRVVDGAASYAATYKQLFTCSSSNSSSASCVREYDGLAFIETHPIWPAVSENLNDQSGGCKQALTTCVNCHPELVGIAN